MSQPLVLAIEPDLRQAAIVKRIVREKALADVVVVDSRDAAMEAIRTRMPDVLLLSALMSPRDEDELIAHLRTLDNSGHLQTHTIPQLASSLDGGEERSPRGLLSAFRRKKEATPAAGCDPDLFAEEIRAYLKNAADKKQHLQHMSTVAPVRRPEPAASAAAPEAPAAEAEDGAASGSAWASPFEWKPSGRPARSARSREESPRKPAPMPAPSPVVNAAPAAAPEPAVSVAPAPAPERIVSAPPAVEAPPVIKPPVEQPAAAQAAVAAPAVAPIVDKAPAPVLVEKSLIAEPVAKEPTVSRPLVSERVGQLVEPPPPKKPAKAAEAPRPKAVADRPAKLTGSQLQDLIKKHVASERPGEDRLGRWARSDATRPPKTATVTGDDVRELISSLSVPPAVASVTYARGVRLRRVRVPPSPGHEAAQAS